MVLNVVRGDNGNGDHVRIRRLRPRVAPMAELFHRVVNHQKRCYNPFGIHRLLRCDGLFFHRNHAGTTDGRQLAIKVRFV